MPQNDMTNIYSPTRYVVSSAGDTPFPRIQDALDAANADGIPAVIYIRPGIYTENLTLYNGIDLKGNTYDVIIDGMHTPPLTGQVKFEDIIFSSATHVLNSAGAGTTDFYFEHCSFDLTNGYVCNMANWDGLFAFESCNDMSTINGIVNNANTGSVCVISNSAIGQADTNILTFWGSLHINNSLIECPINIAGNKSSDFNHSNLRFLLTADTADLDIANCFFESGGNTAITHDSTTAMNLLNTTIWSAAASAIAGTGTIEADTITFRSSNVIAATITLNTMGRLYTPSAQIGFGTGAVTATTGVIAQAAMTNGQLLIGSTGATPVAASLTSAGGTITITPGAGTLNIEGTSASESQIGMMAFASSLETQQGAVATKCVNPAGLNALETEYVLSGFISWTGAGSHYTVSGTNFTLDRGGTGYIKSKLVTWAGAQTVAGLTAGATHYIYIDSTGTIGSTSTRSLALFQDNIVLFEVWVDTDTPANVMVVKENHPVTMPVETSEYLHRTDGVVISNVNNGANIALNGTKKIQINTEDLLEDHGLETTIPDSAATGVNWVFVFTDGAGKWQQHATTDTFSAIYNNAGTVTALTASRFGVFRLYVSKDDIESTTPTYIAVINSAQFNNQTLAQNAINANTISIATNELYNVELAQLGFVIYSQASDQIVSVEIVKSTVRTTSLVGTTNTASLISTSTTNFGGILSATDTTVQQALDTIDNIYAQNSWTPVLTFGGGTTGITYTYQHGWYVDIANICFFWGAMELSSKGSSVGNAVITGLPHTIIENSATVAKWALIDLDANYYTVNMTGIDATTTILIYENGDNIGETILTNANFNNATILEFTGFYVF